MSFKILRLKFVWNSTGAFICFQFDGIRMEKQHNVHPAVKLQSGAMQQGDSKF